MVEPGGEEAEKDSNDRDNIAGPSVKAASRHQCHSCGVHADTWCSRCKLVWYCGPTCQRSDWKIHKLNCKRRELVGGRCDGEGCKRRDCESLGSCCPHCGFLFCGDCKNKFVTELTSRCPNCGAQGKDVRCNTQERRSGLLNLIKERPDDRRKSDWMIALAADHARVAFYDSGPMCALGPVKSTADERLAIAYYEKAGALGNGEAYLRLAELYRQKGDWGKVKSVYKKGADMNNVISIQCLFIEALNGEFSSNRDYPPQVAHTPDPDKAFYWAKKGAELDYPDSYYHLGDCYRLGLGTQVDIVRAAKYYGKGAHRGNHRAMLHYATCFQHGYGVEESSEQARYWLDKIISSENADSSLREQAQGLLADYALQQNSI